MSRLAIHAAATPATVLTGFLGSGKTTLLNHLLTQPGLESTAVLINEFGDLGLDHLLVRRLDETTVLLDSGCMCCTVRGDLVASLRDLYTKRFREEIPTFDRVAIETTGLADPAPIAHTFFSDLFVSSCFRLDAIVTTVDAVNATSQIRQNSESVKQVAIADSLMVTKSDLTSLEAVLRLKEQLRQLNPAATIETVINGVVAPDKLLDIGLFAKDRTARAEEWLRHQRYVSHQHAYHYDNATAHSYHLSGVDSFCVIYDQPLAWADITSVLEEIVSRHGEDLLRMKGILNVQGESGPVVMHGVQHLFHPPVRLPKWPSNNHQSRLVFISRSAAAARIRQYLNTALGASAIT